MKPTTAIADRLDDLLHRNDWSWTALDDQLSDDDLSLLAVELDQFSTRRQAKSAAATSTTYAEASSHLEFRRHHVA